MPSASHNQSFCKMTIRDGSPPQHKYSPLEINDFQSEDEPELESVDVAAIQESLKSGQHRGSITIRVILECARIVSVITGAIVVIGAVVFVRHCAQQVAKNGHHDVVVSDSLTFFLTFFTLCSLAASFTIPFRIRRHSHVMKRYMQNGLETVGVFVKRHVKKIENKRGPPKYEFGGIAAYRLHSGQELFAKSFTKIKLEEFRERALRLVVLPDVPTSAVLKRKIDKAVAGPDASQIMIEAMLVCIAPIVWLLAFTAGSNVLPADDFWIGQFGLLMMLGISLVCGLCFGYYIVETETQEMLYGGAARVPPRAWPPSFQWPELQERNSHLFGLV